jgi:hypothetical protein
VLAEIGDLLARGLPVSGSRSKKGVDHPDEPGDDDKSRGFGLSALAVDGGLSL